MKDSAENNKTKSETAPLNKENGVKSKLIRENREWERTFDALAHFVCTVDMNGAIIRANKAMIARFSPEHGDLIGKDYRLALCGTTSPAQQRTNATVIGDDPSFWLETELPANNGWYRIASSPLFDDDGNQTGAICTISDITERKKAEVKLIRFRAALDSSLDNIYLIDRATMRFVDANKAGWMNLGYSREELLDLGPHDISREYDFEGLAELFDQIISSDDNAGVIESTCLRKDGSEFPVEISIRALELTQPTMIIAAARDISERKHHEQEIIAAKEAAEKASKAKSEFLSLMSHELRTPLNAIMGFSQLLMHDQNPSLSSDQKDNAQEVIKAGDHLLSLINDILDLASLEAGRIHLSIRPIEIASIFEECKMLIKPMASKRGIELDMDNTLQTNAVLEVDSTRFKQILLNLMSNAVKYNVDNGCVAVSLIEDLRGRFRVTVTDTGHGIPMECRDELFIPFSRLNAGASNIEGTGIGLVITKSLVELMGGRIGYEPVHDGGSCFWFELPMLCGIDEPEPTKLEVDAEQNEDSDVKVKQLRTVLYVEDDPANLKLISRLLASQNDIRLITANEPNLGLQLASSHRLDLVLLDINLPGMSGYELFEHLRELPHLRDVPVIAVSANVMPEEIERGQAIGFHDYITKPINVVAFLAKVENALFTPTSSNQSK